MWAEIAPARHSDARQGSFLWPQTDPGRARTGTSAVIAAPKKVVARTRLSGLGSRAYRSAEAATFLRTDQIQAFAPPNRPQPHGPFVPRHPRRVAHHQGPDCRISDAGPTGPGDDRRGPPRALASVSHLSPEHHVTIDRNSASLAKLRIRAREQVSPVTLQSKHALR